MYQFLLRSLLETLCKQPTEKSIIPPGLPRFLASAIPESLRSSRYRERARQRLPPAESPMRTMFCGVEGGEEIRISVSLIQFQIRTEVMRTGFSGFVQWGSGEEMCHTIGG